jgi:hypothetical protein
VCFPDSDELISGSYELVLINIQQTALVLAENYEIFKNSAEMDFHPLQTMFEAKNPDSLALEECFFYEKSSSQRVSFRLWAKKLNLFSLAPIMF